MKRLRDVRQVDDSLFGVKVCLSALESPVYLLGVIGLTLHVLLVKWL
jgi:hypothetical protein